MDSETVKIKASIDEQGNGAFPSNTNIISHDGVPLRDYLLDGNAKKMTSLGYGTQLEISTDCLAVRLDGTQNGKIEKISSLSNETANCPTGLEKGLIATKVQYVTSKGNHATVLLYEVYPVPGRIWVNTYNSSWRGWQQITETHIGITYKNGWIGNGHEPLLTKIGDVVWFNATVRKGTNVVNTVIGTISSAYYYPYISTTAIAVSIAGGGLITIKPNGDIILVTVMPNIDNVQIHAMWRVK